MELLLLVAAFCAFLTLSVVWRGLLIKVMWGWFVVPLGVKPISILWAIGISWFVALLHHDDVKNFYPNDYTFRFLVSLVILGFSYVVHLMMVN